MKLGPSFRLVVAGLALAATAGCVAPPQPEPESTGCDDCNVVLVSIDTLRADHLSLYGYPRPTSPFLLELAREAVVFESFYNNGGYTLPVHMSMMTSLTPEVHKVLPGNERTLEPERVTLAEQLAGAGLRTQGWADRGWMRGKFGFGQGFDVYDDRGGGLARTLPLALRFMDRNRQGRFFTFLHTYDVHSRFGSRFAYGCPGYEQLFGGPAHGETTDCVGDLCSSRLLLSINDRITREPGFHPNEILGPHGVDHLRDRYDGCIRHADDRVRELVDFLKRRGLWDRTLLVVTADHGEEFLDHGRLLHANGPYDELVRIPLLIKLPASRAGGSRVSALASTIDLMPTILDVVGLEPNPAVMGTSLLGVIAGESPGAKRAHFRAGLRQGRFKFFVRRGEPYLFDLVSDPREVRNVAAERADLSRQLNRSRRGWDRLEQGLRQAFTRSLAEEAERSRLEADEVEELRALGYVLDDEGS